MGPLSASAAVGGGLTGVALVEKDVNGDVLVVWSYPQTPHPEEVVLERSQLRKETVNLQFTFSRFENAWQHFYAQVVEENAKLGRVVAFSLVLFTKVYDPERFQKLSEILANRYLETGSPKSILEGYLSVFTTGTLDDKFALANFDVRKAYVASSIKAVINTFGLESIILWVAMMLKKRVVVYCDKMAPLLATVRCMPLFVWHRQNWDLLRPFVNINDKELADLQSMGPYVAGFTDARVKSMEDVYDVLVDIPGQTVTVAGHAKAPFTMGSFHKELAIFLTNAAAGEESDQVLIKALAVRTKELLGNLQSLAVQDEESGQSFITIEMLQAKKLAPNMDRFLYNVALSENLAKI